MPSVSSRSVRSGSVDGASSSHRTPPALAGEMPFLRGVGNTRRASFSGHSGGGGSLQPPRGVFASVLAAGKGPPAGVKGPATPRGGARGSLPINRASPMSDSIELHLSLGAQSQPTPQTRPTAGRGRGRGTPTTRAARTPASGPAVPPGPPLAPPVGDAAKAPPPQPPQARPARRILADILGAAAIPDTPQGPSREPSPDPPAAQPNPRLQQHRFSDSIGVASPLYMPPATNGSFGGAGGSGSGSGAGGVTNSAVVEGIQAGGMQGGADVRAFLTGRVQAPSAAGREENASTTPGSVRAETPKDHGSGASAAPHGGVDRSPFRDDNLTPKNSEVEQSQNHSHDQATTESPGLPGSPWQDLSRAPDDTPDVPSSTMITQTTHAPGAAGLGITAGTTDMSALHTTVQDALLHSTLPDGAAGQTLSTVREDSMASIAAPRWVSSDSHDPGVGVLGRKAATPVPGDGGSEGGHAHADPSLVVRRGSGSGRPRRQLSPLSLDETPDAVGTGAAPTTAGPPNSGGGAAEIVDRTSSVPAFSPRSGLSSVCGGATPTAGAAATAAALRAAAAAVNPASDTSSPPPGLAVVATMPLEASWPVPSRPQSTRGAAAGDAGVGTRQPQQPQPLEDTVGSAVVPTTLPQECHRSDVVLSPMFTPSTVAPPGGISFHAPAAGAPAAVQPKSAADIWNTFIRRLTAHGVSTDAIRAASDEQLMQLLDRTLGFDLLESLMIKTMWHERVVAVDAPRANSVASPSPVPPAVVPILAAQKVASLASNDGVAHTASLSKSQPPHEGLPTGIFSARHSAATAVNQGAGDLSPSPPPQVPEGSDSGASDAVAGPAGVLAIAGTTAAPADQPAADVAARAGSGSGGVAGGAPAAASAAAVEYRNPMSDLGIDGVLSEDLTNGAAVDPVPEGHEVYATVREVVLNTTTSRNPLAVQRILQVSAATEAAQLYDAQRASLPPDVRTPKVLYYLGAKGKGVGLVDIASHGLRREFSRHSGVLAFSTEVPADGACQHLLCEVLTGRHLKLFAPPSNEQLRHFQRDSAIDSVSYDYTYHNRAHASDVATKYYIFQQNHVLPRYVVSTTSFAAAGAGGPAGAEKNGKHSGGGSTRAASATAAGGENEPAQAIMCRHHPEEELRLYCHTDKELTCALCASIGRHANKHCVSLVGLIKSMRGQFASNDRLVGKRLAELEAVGAKLRGQQNALEEAVARSRGELHARASAIRHDVETYEQLILEKLQRKERAAAAVVTESMKRADAQIASLTRAQGCLRSLLADGLSERGISQKASDIIALSKLMDFDEPPPAVLESTVAEVNDFAHAHIARLRLADDAGQ